MSRRKELEHEVSLAQERIKKAPKDTPREIWNFIAYLIPLP